MQDVCIIGVGNLGGALAIALANAGWQVDQLVVRDDKIARKIKRKILSEARITRISNLDHINSPIVFLTVDDPQISTVAASIAAMIKPGQIVYHTSGSLSSSVLTELKGSGASVGSLHPLTSISDPFVGAGQFRGSYFCLEGDPSAVRMGEKLVRSLGGKSFSVETEKKALYHAAAVVAAGHVTALFDSANQMMQLSGLDMRTAKKVLLPLLQSTVSNLETQSPEEALTGTFARLDIEAFRRHLSSFDNVPERLVHIYLELGERSLDLVERREGPGEALDRFRKAVFVAKQKYRC